MESAASVDIFVSIQEQRNGFRQHRHIKRSVIIVE